MASPSSFQPNTNSTAVLAATAATGRVAITMGGAGQVEVQNKSTANWVYVEYGDSTVTRPSPRAARAAIRWALAIEDHHGAQHDHQHGGYL
jgi:hypothetical protein